MSRSCAFSVLIVVVAAVPASASAWAPIDSRRPVWCRSAPYSMNNAGSADLGAASTEMIVRRAMDDWTRVSCTSLTNSWAGRSSARPGSYEGTSVIGWLESGWRSDPNAIGVTGPQWSIGGGGSCIQEADMALNGVNYTWSAGAGSGRTVNAYSIVLHEGGHYYGLGHSSDRSATMYFAYGGGIDTLGADDEAGICALYPGMGSDCTTTGCPAGQECVAATCRTVVGDGTVCAPCTRGSECGGPADGCLRYPDGAGYCGRNCSTDAQCMGDTCTPLAGGGRNCVRFGADGRPSCAGAPPPGCTNDSDCAASELCNSATPRACVPRPTTLAPLGAACAGDTECNSSTCLVTAGGGVCVQSCDWLNPASCPSGFYCNGVATGTCGTGVCLAGSAGVGALGATCADHTDCASIFCSNSRCGAPCDPGVADGCPADFSCRRAPADVCGACRAAAGLGEPCMGNEECSTRFCAMQGSRSFCTDLCDPATMPCPATFTCEPAGAVMVCVPPPGFAPDGGPRPPGTGGRGGGCCSVAVGGSHGAGATWRWLLLLLLLAPAFLRSRRKRTRP